MNGHGEKQVVGEAASVGHVCRFRRRIEVGHERLGPVLDAATLEGGDDLGRRRARDGNRHWQRRQQADGRRVPDSARPQVGVEHERRLIGRGRTLEEATEHADDDVAAVERLEHPTHVRGAGFRVELVAAFGEPRRGRGVDVGAEGDDEDVGVVRSAAGDHPAGLGIDREHPFLPEVHAGLGDVPVVEAHALGRRPAEHHVELGETEGEPLALIDERDVDLVGHFRGQPRGQLEAAEPCAEDQDLSGHRGEATAWPRQVWWLSGGRRPRTRTAPSSATSTGCTGAWPSCAPRRRLGWPTCASSRRATARTCSSATPRSICWKAPSLATTSGAAPCASGASTWRTAPATTSAASVSPTRRWSRCSSTGERRRPSPSTGRRPASPRASCCAATCCARGGAWSPSTTRSSTRPPSARSSARPCAAKRRSWPRCSVVARGAWPTSSPPFRASRTRSSAHHWRMCCSCRAGRARARRLSLCTGPPTSSTPIASG